MTTRQRRDSTRTIWDGLGILIRSDELTLEKLYELVEHDAWMVGRFFKQFVLPELQSVQCLMLDETPGARPPTTLPGCTFEEGLSLTTQGIYDMSWLSRQLQWVGKKRITVSQPPEFPKLAQDCSGVFYAWGFTRDREWVLVQVAYRACKHGYEVHHVCVRRSSLAQITQYAGVDAKDVRSRLASVLNRWLDDRRKQLKRLEETEGSIFTEDMAISIKGSPLFC